VHGGRHVARQPGTTPRLGRRATAGDRPPLPPSRAAPTRRRPRDRSARDHPSQSGKAANGLAVISPPPARSRPEATKKRNPCQAAARPAALRFAPGSGKTRGKARAQRVPPRTSHWSRALQSRSPIRQPYPRLPSAGPSLGGLYIIVIMQTCHGFLSQRPCAGCTRPPPQRGLPPAPTIGRSAPPPPNAKPQRQPSRVLAPRLQPLCGFRTCAPSRETQCSEAASRASSRLAPASGPGMRVSPRRNVLQAVSEHDLPAHALKHLSVAWNTVPNAKTPATIVS